MAKSWQRLPFSMEKDDTEASPDNICELCQVRNRQFFAINTLKNEKNQDYAIKELGLKQHSTICHLCRDDITRINRNPEYKPRWRNQRREKEKCCMSTCNEQAHVHTKIASSGKISEILGISNAPFPAPLCTHHYYLVYDTLQPKVVQCSLCKSSLKGVAARRCPDPQRVQKYLKESIGFRGKITDDVSLCTSCYKSHLQILKKVPSSTDDDLLSIILNLKGSITLNEDLPCAEAVVNKAIYSTAVYVGERLIQQEALLLPVVYMIFTDFLSQFKTEANVESEVSEKNARWLLSNLIIHLQHHLSYAIRVKKLGTILYRSNGDFLTALTFSLHKQKAKPQKCNSKCNDLSSLPKITVMKLTPAFISKLEITWQQM